MKYFYFNRNWLSTLIGIFLGILKYSIPDYIKKNKDLMSKITNIDSAKIEDGGSGAFYIYIKKKL